MLLLLLLLLLLFAARLEVPALLTIDDVMCDVICQTFDFVGTGMRRIAAIMHNSNHIKLSYIVIGYDII